MRTKAEQLLAECLENGGIEDHQALIHLLAGMKNKIDGKTSTYISGILHYEKNPNSVAWEGTIPINPLLYNSLGIVHGGITAVLMDTVMGTLANSLAPEGSTTVTSNLNMHYLAPGSGDFLRCRAEAAHAGKNTIVVSAETFLSDGRKAAFATGTFFILPIPAGGGE